MNSWQKLSGQQDSDVSAAVGDIISIAGVLFTILVINIEAQELVLKKYNPPPEKKKIDREWMI